MNNALTILVCLGALGAFATAGPAVTIETVTVGDPNNPADTEVMSDGTTGYGTVAYTYHIGKYEVTAGQYCEFLNAVADDDPYALYSTSMDTANPFGCNIKRTGSSGSYQYSVDPNWANRPVNYVSWGDAARFANWLHNGQPTGAQTLSTTENGAYYLNGATTDAALLAVTREADWTWAIPTEDEWYKAAYYSGAGSTYYDYPTGTDSTPSNDLVEPNDPGNNATFLIGPSDYTIGSPYYRTEVGAHENSESPYGTFDQGGNVWEWNEAILSGLYRGARGGSAYDRVDDVLQASSRYYSGRPEDESLFIGFRVAEVPEPTCLAILALGGAGILLRRRV